MGTGRTIRKLDTEWKFRQGDADGAFYRGFDDSGWETVTVPHDWSIAEEFSEDYSSGTGYVAGGVGWYRKAFSLPGQCRGRKVFITFDGVYNNSQVWCNGNNLGKRPYGYSTFTYDLTPFCAWDGESNIIAVKVNHASLADSRWFTGSGIYRDVRLTITGAVRLAEWSPFVSTAGVTGQSAVLAVEACVVNGEETAREVTVRHTVTAPDGESCCRNEQTFNVLPDKIVSVRSSLSIADPCLWGPDFPALYSVETEIVSDGVVTDRVVTKTGIRCFAFDPARGFFLNGEEMKLKGVCVHHDAGCLGAAVPIRVWEHRLRLLKEMGCNAIRMSHNPPDPKLLDLCDEVGFLVMDEAFDEWEGVKNKWSRGHNVYPPRHFGYGDDFPNWHEADLKTMVLRDRNHPSIILWSVGNEVDYPNDPYCHPFFKTMVGNNDANKPAEEQRYDPGKPNAERLATIARRLVALVKECDATRPVTAAIAFPELSNQTGYCAALDVVGYNYKEHLYATDHARFPNRIIYGSENSAGYGQWIAVRDNPRVCGQFVWTGIDYLGEAKGWPVRAAPAGFIDLAGFPKPMYFFRKSLWKETPVLFLAARKRDRDAGEVHKPIGDESPHWNWATADFLEIVCYTNRSPVELFVNERSLGAKRLDDSTTGYLSWFTEFEPGSLTAVASDGEGVAVTCALKTAEFPYAVVVLSNPTPIRADGTDTARIEFGIVDENGSPVYLSDVAIAVTVEGPGTLIGLENGDIRDVEPYSSPFRKALHGRLAAYVRSTVKAGSIRVSAVSSGLIAAIATVEALPVEIGE